MAREEVLLVLHKDQLQKIEQQCSPLMVNQTTTDLQTSYILGQQSVLKMLRDGWLRG